ncbi:MAG: holo-ACP synthase [Candidatus Omnitrophica bacterium]|nr:holo-ACP synthase [Candidatus Omnitrophota bacterium]
MTGCGVDLVGIPEMQRAIKRWKRAFLERVFTPGELRYALSKRASAQHLAARFAAKEAVLKAFGPWKGRVPCALKEIEVVNHASGQPRITLHGAARTLQRRSRTQKIIISLSHTKEFAVATAILMRRGRA